MTRFERKPTPVLHSAIAVACVAVFISDLFTPLGVAVWAFYLAPVVLSLFLWRSSAPLLVALTTMVLMVLGFFLSPRGVHAGIATINRLFGIVIVWIVAGVAYQFIRSKLSVNKEQWLQTGQTRLSERMRGEMPMHQLGENVLRFLSEYLDAHAGAFFVEDSGVYRRFAGYAIPPQSTLPDRVAPGEGLLGQAVKDGRTVIVKDVPEGYFAIGSGLGQSPPRHLLIAPVTADRVINAVLELAFVHPVYASDTELLERVSESIGIAVRSSKDRGRLQELLDETQRQAVELQAQTEELRVSNEELAEQSRALKESQARLELQQTELEQNNRQLEDQTRLLEVQKDELTRAKGELENQARELQRASRYKSDFLANMSHELRTPLNSSLILAKLLSDNREGNLTPEQVRYAQTIQSSGNDLLTLITDILDLSKIEAGRMEVIAQQISIKRLVDNLLRVFQPLAADKKVGFRTEIVEGTPEGIVTDPQKVEQVLKNLFSNAFKFTEKGEVVLQVAPVEGHRIAFSIRDTGIGIPGHQHQMIFEPFRQADGTTNRKYGGTGLGLSISRELVQLLGGSIGLSSAEGQGSTFTVVLPEVYDPALASAVLQAEPPAVPSPAPTQPPAPVEQGGAKPVPIPRLEARFADDRERLSGSSRVILAVEDDLAFASILFELAHELGFQCLVATTAEEGLALAAQFAPSGVILDVGLPDNSGLSVLDRLKTDTRTRHIPVHVVSASDYAQTALAMGAVGYMLKPVRRDQLTRAFQELESRLNQRVRRVLVVEDDPVQLDSLSALLQSADVETIGVRTAADCLEKLRSVTVDCMVLDLNLPDSSGFALLETLSRQDAYSFPPVIIYTGRELSGEEEERLRKYSKSIIIKGAKSPERLLDEVTLFLHQVVTDLPARQQKLLEKARSRDAALEGKNILVAEDDVRNVFAVTSILEPRGAKVKIARNGREAVEALESSTRAPDEHIDLVLMDIMMPEMDGLTAMREIRKRPQWKNLPIIALTAKAMSTDQEQCLAAGADDYMAKPLDVDKLLSLVRVWMHR